jgi:hypothetical protein
VQNEEGIRTVAPPAVTASLRSFCVYGLHTSRFRDSLSYLHPPPSQLPPPPPLLHRHGHLLGSFAHYVRIRRSYGGGAGDHRRGASLELEIQGGKRRWDSHHLGIDLTGRRSDNDNRGCGNKGGRRPKILGFAREEVDGDGDGDGDGGALSLPGRLHLPWPLLLLPRLPPPSLEAARPQRRRSGALQPPSPPPHDGCVRLHLRLRTAAACGSISNPRQRRAAALLTPAAASSRAQAIVGCSSSEEPRESTDWRMQHGMLQHGWSRLLCETGSVSLLCALTPFAHPDTENCWRWSKLLDMTKKKAANGTRKRRAISGGSVRTDRPGPARHDAVRTAMARPFPPSPSSCPRRPLHHPLPPPFSSSASIPRTSAPSHVPVYRPRRRAVAATASLHLGPGEIAELARNKVGWRLAGWCPASQVIFVSCFLFLS